MDIEYLIDCIENEIESSNFDFKKDIYDFKVQKSKQDLLIDVISLANSHAKGDKYIITGVKLYLDGNRDLDGITESKIKDGADYQSLINDNVEPNVIVDFSIIDYSGNKYGVFKIGKENSDPPYLLGKKYGDLEKGFIKIRKGQKNEFISRRDLDLYYSKKINNELSEIKLKGIIKNKVHEQFEMNNYTCDIDFQLLRNKIYDLFVEMYNYKLEESCINSLSLGNPIKFEDKDIKNIKYYSENNDMIITKDFFNIGNLKCWQIARDVNQF